MYSTVDSGLTYTYTSLVVSLVVCDLLNSHLRRRGNETVEFRCVGAAPVGWDGGIDGGGLRRDDEQKAIKT